MKKGVKQGFVRGDADKVFKSITEGAEQMKSGVYKLADGRYVNMHKAGAGLTTIDINKGGELTKVRFVE